MKRLDEQPVLETERLRLRPFQTTDAALICQYAGDLRVAEWTSLVPHPYPERAADDWIAAVPSESDIPFAIVLRESDELVGVIGVCPEPNGLIAELGFWVGVPFWGRGYCTEAAREILRFCFEDLDLQRVFAGHFAGNDASGRVQEKIGMKKEGMQLWGGARFGELKDRVMYGLIRPDWEDLQTPG